MSFENNFREFSAFKVELIEQALWIHINRPKSHNSLDSVAIHELHCILESLKYPRNLRQEIASDWPRLVIFTGGVLASRGVFSSGVDIKAADKGIGGPKWNYNSIRSQETLADLILLIRNIPQPVICCIEGAAHGAGLAIACASDIRIGSSMASFSAAFSKLGLSGTDMGVSFLLPKLIGQGRASEMMLTGNTMNAQEALQSGLLNHLCINPIEKTKEVARSLLKLSFWGLHLTKRQINHSMDYSSLQAAITSENSHQMYLMNREDVIKAARIWLDSIGKAKQNERSKL